MARDEKEVIIDSDTDDKGKTFRLRKMAAMDLHKWRRKGVMMMARSAENLPPGMFFMTDLFAMASFGIGPLLSGLGKLPYEEVEILLTELWEGTMVSYSAAGSNSVVTSQNVIRHEIADANTFFFLEEEILNLNMGFTLGGILSTFLGQFQKQDENTPTIPTSPTPSPSS